MKDKTRLIPENKNADKKEKRAMALNKKSSLFVNSVKVINQSMPKQIE